MKFNVSILFALLLITNFISAKTSKIEAIHAEGVFIMNVFNGDASLTTQAEVDAFGANNYTEITGNTTITGTNITSLTSLNTIQLIGGYLRIFNTSIDFQPNLFESLETVGGYIGLSFNNSLTGFDSFNSLTSVDELYISNINSPVIDGFENLLSITNSLDIGSVSDLESISGFNDLTSIGNFVLQYAESLNDISGLQSLDTVNGDFIVVQNMGNFSISSVTNSISFVGGDIIIEDNPFIESSCLFPNLQTLEGDLEFTNNESITSLCGFSSINNLNLVRIVGNDSMLSIDAFNGLSTVGQISIEGNIVLQSITGLQQVNQAESIFLRYNNLLTSIDQFSNLTQIINALYFESNALDFSQDVFPLLETVGQGLGIIDNNSSTAIIGFNNVISINGYVRFTDISNTSIVGFNSLDTVLGVIIDNTALETVNGFDQLMSTGDVVIIVDNDLLTTIDGFQSLVTIEGNIEIENNATLNVQTELFPSLVSLNGELIIKDNPSQEILTGFNSLTHIADDVTISDNFSLNEIIGFQNLLTIDGNFNFFFNHQFSSFGNTFENLNIVTGLFRILNNTMLEDLGVFENLEAVDRIFIDSNDNLINVDFLNSIDEDLNLLLIQNNASLSACNNEFICDFLNNNGNAMISNNAEGCNNVIQVLESCNLSVRQNDTYEFEIYPNPTSGKVLILEDAEDIISIEISNNLGQILNTEYQTNEIDLSNISKGIYFLSITSANGINGVVQIIKN